MYDTLYLCIEAGESMCPTRLFNVPPWTCERNGRSFSFSILICVLLWLHGIWMTAKCIFVGYVGMYFTYDAICHVCTFHTYTQACLCTVLRYACAKNIARVLLPLEQTVTVCEPMLPSPSSIFVLTPLPRTYWWTAWRCSDVNFSGVSVNLLWTRWPGQCHPNYADCLGVDEHPVYLSILIFSVRKSLKESSLASLPFAGNQEMIRRSTTTLKWCNIP